MRSPRKTAQAVDRSTGVGIRTKAGGLIGPRAMKVLRGSPRFLLNPSSGKVFVWYWTETVGPD